MDDRAHASLQVTFKDAREASPAAAHCLAGAGHRPPPAKPPRVTPQLPIRMQQNNILYPVTGTRVGFPRPLTQSPENATAVQIMTEGNPAVWQSIGIAVQSAPPVDDVPNSSVEAFCLS